MNLSEYFATYTGIGVLSTSDASGKVDAALYAHPHFIDDTTIAFIMADKLSHANLQSNPSAVYLFIENDSYEGKRLYLTKISEEKDSPQILELRRSKHGVQSDKNTSVSKYLVCFKIDKVRTLVGDDTLHM